jgi:hypothetical protein
MRKSRHFTYFQSLEMYAALAVLVVIVIIIIVIVAYSGANKKQPPCGGQGVPPSCGSPHGSSTGSASGNPLGSAPPQGTAARPPVASPMQGTAPRPQRMGSTPTGTSPLQPTYRLPLTPSTNRVTLSLSSQGNKYIAPQLGTAGLVSSQTPVVWSIMYNNESGGYNLQSGGMYVVCNVDFGCTASEISLSNNSASACSFSFEAVGNGYIIGTGNNQYLANNGDYLYFSTDRNDASIVQVYGM